MRMTLMDITELAKDNWGFCLIVVLSLVEVSKIKINPWSWLFRWIGNIFMAGVREDMKQMKTELADLKKDMSEMKDENRENEAKAARTRILRCSDESYQGQKHSKEYFDNILADITFYKRYCSEHPDFQNDMTVIAVQRIEEIYQRCLREHDFL